MIKQCKCGKKHPIRWTRIVDLRTGKITKCKIYDNRHFKKGL